MRKRNDSLKYAYSSELIIAISILILKSKSNTQFTLQLEHSKTIKSADKTSFQLDALSLLVCYIRRT